jgi:hypothetical protein
VATTFAGVARNLSGGCRAAFEEEFAWGVPGLLTVSGLLIFGLVCGVSVGLIVVGVAGACSVPDE